MIYYDIKFADSRYELKIFIFPGWYPSKMDPNGSPFVRVQAQALARSGHEVTVVFTQPYSLKTIAKARRLMFGLREAVVGGVREILSYFPKTHLRQLDEITRNAYGRYCLKRLMATAYRPDVVHIHTYLAGNLGIWFSRKYNVPLVVTEHYTGFARGIVKPWEFRLAARTYRNSVTNIAVSGPFASLLEERFQQRFEVVPNLVDTRLFGNQASSVDRREHPLFTFLFVGSLHSKKNPEMLLNAFRTIRNDLSDIRLIYVGEGELRDRLEQLVEKHGLGNDVTFKGFLFSPDIAALMAKVDALVLPSRFETFGIVAIEAMAAGLPVIATRSGGPESFIVPGETGFIIDQDQGQLENAMRKCIEHPWNHKKIAKSVQYQFSEQTVTKLLTNTYNKAHRKRKILQATSALTKSGGISQVAYELAHHLTLLGERVVTITSGAIQVEENDNLGEIRIIKIPTWYRFLPKYFRNYLHIRTFTRKVDKIFRSEGRNPDVITISHRDSFGADMAVGHSCHRKAIEIKKKDGRKRWFFNPIHRFYLKQERKIFRSQSVELIAISNAIADEYHRYYKQPYDRITVVPNGVDTDRFNPGLRAKVRPRVFSELGLAGNGQNEPFVISIAGNEFWRKGLMPLIESLPLVAAESQRPELVVIGGADRGPFKKRAVELGVEHQVHFVGRQERIEEYFASSDVFVLPTSYEPFGLVCLEAMATGIPLVAPAEGGIKDYLNDGVNGLAIKIDPADIAQKIQYLMEHPKIRGKMGANARDTALNHQWANIVKRYPIEKVWKNRRTSFDLQ